MRDSNQHSGCFLIGLVTITVLGLFVVFFPQLLHWVVFGLIFRNSVVWLTIIVAFASLVMTHSARRTARWVSLSTCILFAFASLFMVFNNHAIEKHRLVNQQVYHSFEALPEDMTVVRTPYQVAQRKIESTFSKPGYQPGEVEPINEPLQGTGWVAPHQPQGLRWGRGKVDGVTILSRDLNATQVAGELTYVENGFAWNSVEWRVQFTVPGSTVDEVYLIRSGDSVLRVASLISYDFSFPVFVPKWGGVVIVNPDGSMERLTPEESASRFPGQPLFPLSLAEKIGDGFYHKESIFPILNGYQGATKIPGTYGEGNTMPYIVGPYMFIGLTPYNGGTGLVNQLIIDGVNGEMLLRRIETGQNFKGPQPAINSMRQIPLIGHTYQIYDDLGQVSTPGDTIIIEPVPVARKSTDGQTEFWWAGTAVSTDYEHVRFIAVANPKSNVVYRFETYNQLEQFLQGREVGLRYENSQNTGEATEPGGMSPDTGTDLSQLSDEELMELDTSIKEELYRRLKN
ncbi:MAG: hypothetical protein ACOCXQ_00010 [Patescibacteria group bacterium]